MPGFWTAPMGSFGGLGDPDWGILWGAPCGGPFGGFLAGILGGNWGVVRGPSDAFGRLGGFLELHWVLNQNDAFGFLGRIRWGKPTGGNSSTTAGGCAGGYPRGLPQVVLPGIPRGGVFQVVP